MFSCHTFGLEPAGLRLNAHTHVDELTMMRSRVLSSNNMGQANAFLYATSLFKQRR